MASKSVARFCFAAALSITCSFAITPPIGVASALGSFTLNDAKTEGNANVFEGSEITTTTASSHVYLESGAMLTLGINSQAKFYKDHLLLQQGATRVSGMNHYVIQAASYKVQSVEPLSEAVIRIADGQVQVAALSGAVNVFSQKGALLSRVGAGTASAFDNRDNANTTANPNPQATNGQSGATAGQSGATAATADIAHRHFEEKLFTSLGVAMGGLGLAVDAILQPGSTAAPAPTSP